MRANLDIPIAAKALAPCGETTTDAATSDPMRQAPAQPSVVMPDHESEPAAFYGFRPFLSRRGVVTNEQVDKLRDEEGV